MTVTLGSGEWAFEVEESWAKVPDDIVLGDCAGPNGTVLENPRTITPAPPIAAYAGVKIKFLNDRPGRRQPRSRVA
jgi:hypothetical protein